MMLLILMFVLGGEQAVTLDHQNMLEIAAQAYARGPGQTYSVQAQGLDEAGDLVAGRFREISLGATPEVNTSHGDRGEYLINLETSISLANTPRLERRLLAAESREIRQEGKSDALEYVLDVMRAYAKAYEADMLLEHIRELHEQASELEQAMTQQASRQLISQADLYAWRVLTGQYGNEIREMETRYRSARAELVRLLGGPVQLIFPQPSELEAMPENPFAALAGVSESFPDQLLAGARAETARRQAHLAAAANAPKLAPNLHYRDEPDGNGWLGLGVKLSFSLRPRKDAQWRKHRAEADAWDARAAWINQTVRAELARRGEQYLQNSKQTAAYLVEVLEPMRRQVALYDNAVAGGHMERRFQIQAQSDLHEAEHTYLLLLHRLWADRLEAQLWNTMITKGATQ